MRYLQGRNQFLNTKIQLKSSNFNQDFKNSNLIKEASAGMGGWENDITWGGSLIGRLLNSTIRRTAIYAKTTKIPFLLRQLENQLLSLVAEVSLSEEDQKKLIVTQFKFLIMKVYNIVVSGDSVDKKLTQLIGDGATDDQGTLNETIKLVEKIEDNLLENKEELLTKLKGFRDALKEKDFEPEEFTDEDEEEEEEGGEGQRGKGEGQGQGKDSDSSKSGSPEFNFYTNTSNLFKALIELNTVIQNKRVGNEGDSDKAEYILGNHKLTPGQKYLWTNSKVNNAKPIEVILISTDFVIQPGKFKNYLADVKKTEKLKPGVVFVKPHSQDQPMKIFYKDLKWIKPLNLEPETEYLYKDLDGKESVVKLVSLTHKKDKGVDDKWFTDDDSELKEIRKGSAYVLRKDEDGNFSKGSIVFSSLLSKTKVGSTGGSTGNVKPLDIIVGKEYLHTNKEGDAKIVKVISLDKSTGKQGGVLGKDSVFVAFKNKTGKYAIKRGVFKAQLSELKSDSFKESYFYMNESLPIFENEAKLGGDEKNAKIAWSKVLNAVKNSKLSENSKLMKQVIEESKEGEKLNKKVIIALGKQIIKNETTEGKPISFEALIKEEMGTIPSKYSDITQTVSLMARILLAFKDDTGLLSQLGESGKPIKKFIAAYDEMKKNLEKLPKDSAQSKKEEDKKEVQKVENIKDFYSFKMRLFEQADEEDEVEEDSGDMDFVEETWYEFFEEGEEEAWIVSEEDGKKLQKSGEESTKNPFAIQDKDYDKVVRIVNIFAKAYKCYATDYIPSGRPGGKTSLKTHREYKYIGTEERTPAWSDTGSAGPGPWAAKIPFGKWEDGVMKILEKPELRSVLANAKFIPKGVKPLGSGVTGKSNKYSSDESAEFQKAVRAGRSLFDFMNDLLAGEGEFSEYRKRIMKEYFSGADKVDEAELKKIENESSKLKPSPDEVSSPSEVGFFQLEQFEKGTLIKVDEFKKDKFFYRTFFRIKYKDGGNFYYMIGQFLNSTGDKIIVKFQKPDKELQSIITRYLSDDIKQNKWKLTDLNTKELSLFVGVIEMSSLSRNKSPMLRSVELKRYGSYEVSAISSKKIEIDSIEILGRYNDDKKLEPIKKIKRDKSLPYDIDYENIKVDDFKEKKT